MDAGLIGGLIGIGVMVGVVVIGTLYEKCKQWRFRKKPISSQTPLLATPNPHQDLAAVLQRQRSHVKVASLLPKAKPTVTITRQNGSRSVLVVGEAKN